MAKKKQRTKTLETPLQRKAISSPIRMEIMGQFTAEHGMSVADIATRMGRTPGSLYYHFDMLEEAGLLHRIGSRPSGKRAETLYEPTAERFELAASGPDSDVTRTMAQAFRMAERDLEAALTAATTRVEGDDRNFFATRLHARMNREVLAEVNEHLNAVLEILARETGKDEVPEDADQYCSLTLALLPLRGRGDRS